MPDDFEAIPASFVEEIYVGLTVSRLARLADGLDEFLHPFINVFSQPGKSIFFLAVAGAASYVVGVAIRWPEVWAGLVVCGLFTTAAIYVRRYRDDS